MVKRRSFVAGLVALASVLATSLVVQGCVYAYSSGTYGSGTYGSCQYGSVCSITLASGGTVNLDVSPTQTGKCTIQSDTVSVLTDDANGYNLALADGAANTALLNGAHSIAATGGTTTTPAVLSGNAWGYRVDNLGNFGSGPSSAQTNVNPGSLLFSAVPASNQPADTLAATTAAANPAAISTIWYGICANTNVTSGSYTSQIIYTAVAN